jgi:peptidoglycan/LPS O-acetylase OafA/YrhL
LGVDLFFVLSGFLITDILLNTMNTRNYFKNFYARRVLRIFPVYYLSLFLFIIILPALAGFPPDAGYYQAHQWWFWTYLQNWALIFSYDWKANTLNHFWSLAVEEQYYLVWPLVILFFKKPKRLLTFCLLTLITVIVARIFIWIMTPGYHWMFLFTRIDGLLIGSMLALICRINQDFLRKYSTALILSLAAFNFLIYFLDKPSDFPIWAIAGFTTFSVIFALIIYQAIEKNDKTINFILTTSFLRFLGKYSYGFYIFHWPVYVWIKPYTDSFTTNWLTQASLAQLFCSALLSTFTGLIVSIIIYHIFEKHFLKLKKYFA